MSKLGENAADRVSSQAWICVHNLVYRHACRKRLENESYRNARAAHTWTTSKMFGVGDDPMIHGSKFNVIEMCLSTQTVRALA